MGVLSGDTGGSRRNTAYASVSLATDLANLPPAFVCVGDLDIFLDEDIDYAQRLRQASVPTEFHVYEGAIHGFDMLAPDAAITQRLRADVNNALKTAFDAALSAESRHQS